MGCGAEEQLGRPVGHIFGHDMAIGRVHLDGIVNDVHPSGTFNVFPSSQRSPLSRL